MGCHSLLQGIFLTQIEHRSPTLQVDSLRFEPHGLYYVEIESFYADFLKLAIYFNHKWLLNFFEAFSESIEMIMFLFKFFFIKLLYFNWRLLYNIVVVFTYIDMNKPWVYICPPVPNTPPHLPPNPIPLGFVSVLALSVLFLVSNLDWSSILHLEIYMLFS